MQVTTKGPLYPLDGTKWQRIELWCREWFMVRYRPDSNKEYVELFGVITESLKINLQEWFGISGYYGDILSWEKSGNTPLSVSKDIRLKTSEHNDAEKFLPGFTFKTPKNLSDMLNLEDHVSETGYYFYDCTATRDIGNDVKKGNEFSWIHMNLKTGQYELYDEEDEDNWVHIIPFEMNIEISK